MNPVLLDLGFLEIRWYSVIILVAALLALNLVIKEGQLWRIPEPFINNLFFYIIIFGIIGARLYFVLFNLDYYSNNLSEIYKIWQGGLAIHGGIIAGLLVTIIYGKKYKVQLFRLTDMIVVGLIFAQTIGRWGNFFNGEAHGAITTLEHLQSLHIPQFIINGMHIDGVYYEPTFLYESLWCLIGFVILLIVRRLKYIKVGQITSLYLIWYGIGRFFIEGMRTDSLMLGDFKMAQIISIIMIVMGILIFILKKGKSRFENRYNDPQNTVEVRF